MSCFLEDAVSLRKFTHDASRLRVLDHRFRNGGDVRGHEHLVYHAHNAKSAERREQGPLAAGQVREHLRLLLHMRTQQQNSKQARKGDQSHSNTS